MRRLHRIGLALLMAVCVANPSAAFDGGVTQYLLDGESAENGTSAVIDFAGSSMLVSGELFRFSKCEPATYEICIRTDYMTLIVPSEVFGRKTGWELDGIAFRFSRNCKLKIGRKAFDVRVIHSVQGDSAFDFYVTDAYELLGWRHTYKTVAGAFETYRYLKSGY